MVDAETAKQKKRSLAESGEATLMELGQSEADNNDDKGNVEAQNRIICFTMLPENLIIESLPYSTVSRHYFLAGSPWHVTQLGEAEPSLARQLKHSH